MCTYLILHGSQPDNKVRLMNSGKCGNRQVITALFLLILRGLKEEKTSDRGIVDTTLEYLFLCHCVVCEMFEQL